MVMRGLKPFLRIVAEICSKCTAHLTWQDTQTYTLITAIACLITLSELHVTITNANNIERVIQLCRDSIQTLHSLSENVHSEDFWIIVQTALCKLDCSINHLHMNPSSNARTKYIIIVLSFTRLKCFSSTFVEDGFIDTAEFQGGPLVFTGNVYYMYLICWQLISKIHIFYKIVYIQNVHTFKKYIENKKKLCTCLCGKMLYVFLLILITKSRRTSRMFRKWSFVNLLLAFKLP